NPITFTNQGTLKIGTAEVIALSGTFTTATLGTVQLNGGALSLAGTVDNTGSTLNISTTGSWYLANCTIKGGTINASPTALMTIGSGTLDGVTLGTDVTVTDYGNLYVTHGLTLNNKKLMIASSGNTYNQTIYFIGTQTLGGTGELIFGGNSP